MDFTREPVIETIITPREGYKIVLRNSKAIGQEEYFLEVVEVVSFGHALFFRSLEKPKSFLLPVADYELLEVRETRMVLKHGTSEKSIKIAGGKEAAPKVTKTVAAAAKEESSETEPKGEKKRERRRRARRRGRDQGGEESLEGEAAIADEASEQSEEESSAESKVEIPATPIRSVAPARIFPAPTTLISDTLQRYRQDDSFKEAFYPPKKEEETVEQSSLEKEKEDLQQEEEPISPSLPEESFAPESLWDFADEIESSDELETSIEQEPK